METIGREEFDVIVVGAGNAATCAALSARENGARVLMLEIAQNRIPGQGLSVEWLADAGDRCAARRGLEPDRRLYGRVWTAAVVRHRRSGSVARTLRFDLGAQSHL